MKAIKEAAARGEAARVKALAEAAEQEAEKARAELVEAQVRKTALTKAIKEWIRHELPDLVELVASKGHKFINLANVEITAPGKAYKYYAADSLIYEVCKAEGLDVEHDQTWHEDWHDPDGGYSTSSGYTHTYRLKW